MYDALCVLRITIVISTVGVLALILIPIFWLLGINDPFQVFVPVFEKLSFNKIDEDTNYE